LGTLDARTLLAKLPFVILGGRKGGLLERANPIYQPSTRSFPMQRNNGTGRIIVAGYSSDDPPIPHIGVSNMGLFFVLGEIAVLIVWVTTPLLVFFALKR
jgi:hypothetical protein